MANAPVLDLNAYPTAKDFVSRCHEFFREVKNLYVFLVVLIIVNPRSSSLL